MFVTVRRGSFLTVLRVEIGGSIDRSSGLPTFKGPSTVQTKMLSTCVVLIGVLQPFVLLVSAQGSIVGQQCNTPNNQPGQCYSINNCPVLHELWNRQSPAASDYVGQSLCALENDILIVCCATDESDPGDSIVGQQCTTTNNEPGLCNSINNCPVLNELVIQQGLAATNYVNHSVCALENNIPIICCPTGETNIGGNNKSSTTPYGPLLPPYCGLNKRAHTRVISGSPARRGAWPWIAALGFRNKNNPSKPLWGCGGTLISARHVLTAAHCAVMPSLYMVRLGDLNLARDDDGAHPIEVDIEQKIVHPGFRTYRYVNDIAVLRLAQEVPFSDNLHPICLPVDESFKNMDLTGMNPFVAGWGATSDNASEEISFARSDDLLESQIPVISKADCQLALSPFRAAVIDDRVLCAGFALDDSCACQGDSGGPLIVPWIPVRNRFAFYQIGVASYGHGCALPGYPGVYARVTEYLDFILKALQ
ncbi:venom protease-like isoform X1 [Halictus rubicundus]|uniref:venom protease-like isoform X1 n=1 Tax=Halictus rubicundus TaxID=77578 RepID=UPI00403538FC